MVLMSCFFMGNSPFEFAILCMTPRTRCPLYSGRDSYGPGAYSLGNLCEFQHGTQCPLSKGLAPWIHMALPPSFSQCVATCSKFLGNISIRTVYKNISFFLATSCYKGYADRNSATFTRYPRSNVVAPPPRLGRLRTTVAKLRRAWLKLRLFSGWHPFSAHQPR